MIKTLKIFLIFVLCLFSFSSIQAQVNDAGLWLGIGIEKQITQAFSVEIDHSSRFNENISELGTIINELGVNYKLDKKSQFSVFFRYYNQLQLNNQYKPVSKLYVDYSYKAKAEFFDINLRLRFQMQQKNIFVFDSDGSTSSAIRPKISLKHSFNKFEPYVSVEVYIPVFYNDYKPIDKIRLSAGIDYSFSKMHSVDLGYLVQREYFAKNPETDFIVQLGYKFKF